MDEALKELPDLSKLAYTDEYIIRMIGKSFTVAKKRGAPSQSSPWEVNLRKKISEKHMSGLASKVSDHYRKKGIHLDVWYECEGEVFTILVKNIKTTAEIEN